MVRLVVECVTDDSVVDGSLLGCDRGESVVAGLLYVEDGIFVGKNSPAGSASVPVSAWTARAAFAIGTERSLTGSGKSRCA